MIQKLNVFIIWHGQSIFVKIRIKQLKKVFNRGNFVGSVGVHKNPFLILAWVRWKNNKHFRANTSVPMKHDEHQMLQYSILLRLNFWWAYIYFSARYLKKTCRFDHFSNFMFTYICKVNFAMREVRVSLWNTISISWKIWRFVHVILWTSVPYDLKKRRQQDMIFT